MLAKNELVETLDHFEYYSPVLFKCKLTVEYHAAVHGLPFDLESPCEGSRA